MNIDGAILAAVLFTLVFKFINGTILCSNCRSDQDVDCETNPPDPQPCTAVGSGMSKSCSIVRILNKSTGALNLYIRSCTATTSPDGCVDTQPGFQTCATICYTDGCNTSTSLHAHRGILTFVLSAMLVTYIMLKTV